MIFLELHRIFYFEIILTSENVYVEKKIYFEIFLLRRIFYFTSLVHRLRIFLSEINTDQVRFVFFEWKLENVVRPIHLVAATRIKSQSAADVGSSA